MDKNYKRPLDDDDDKRPGNDTKKCKATHDTTTSSGSKTANEIVGLSNLCDDVIMHIFKYLPHDSLANMSQ